MASFTERYEKLNAKQKEAVDTIYGPVLVIAGPGSGKTELLSMRTANILKLTDASPANILCLTFTDKAAKNMRERLASIIGQEAYAVNIHTFHSFGSEILNRYRYRISHADELVAIDDIELSNIFSQLQDALPWDDPWKGGGTWRDIQSAIEALKKAGITPREYRDIIDENAKIYTLIAPEITEKIGNIFSLGQKKEEKAEKVRLFSQFRTDIVQYLYNFQEKHGLVESFGAIFLRELDTVMNALENEYDTKPLTAWKSAWLEKDMHGDFVLKESQRIEKYTSLVGIYEQYETILKERGFIDFSDMILQSILLIEEHPDIRANLAEQYQWIMIDEYQDTNDAQLRLVTDILSVHSESANVFAVGDDDQSIFKFQGANTRNIREFHDRWRQTQLIILDTNYRSFQEIIESSRTLMVGSLYDLSEIFPGVTKSFLSARGIGGDIAYRRFASEVEEIAWVVQDIRKKIQSGVDPSSIAIITKKNNMLERTGKALLSEKIPIVLSKDISIFETESVNLLIDMLRLVASLTTFQDESLLVRILSHPMWKIHRLVLWNIARDIHHARKEEKKNWIEVLAGHPDTRIRRIAHFFMELSLTLETKRLEDIIDVLSGANALVIPSDYDEDPEIQQIQIPLGERETFTSPLYTYFFSDADHTSELLYHLESMRTFIERIRTFRKRKGILMTSDFVEFMTLVDRYNITITVHESIGNEKTSVNLITAHKAKGLEFAHVYAIGGTEGQYKRGKNTTNLFPKNLPLLPDSDDDEDIRRLVYTVWTRAKDTLTATYAVTNIDGKADSPLSILTPFIQSFEDTKAENVGILSVLQEESHDIFLGPYEHEEKDFLRDRIEKQFVMNASALQNFLDVSSGGPSRFLANTILRFPQAKALPAVYGTAIHSALENFFSEGKHSGKFEKEILFSSFLTAMEREGFPSTQSYFDMIARGKDKIELLYGELIRRDYGEIQTEFDFRNVGGGVFLDDIRLTGKIDRIEIVGDGRIRVTDYKTGSGFRDFSDSGTKYEKIKKWKYKLQLVFYALLFSLSPRFSAFPVREFELFFVEYDEKLGEFITIREYIQEGEIERLKRLIQVVMQKVQALDFPDITGYSDDVKGIRAFEDDLLEGRV